MSKIAKISGFPEWLPSEKRFEEVLINKIKSVYESYGFIPIETPAVELTSTLFSKGFADKEVYVLQRAKSEGDDESSIGLHFDLTVPFARYVAQHFDKLTFPFKRYQLQKVWRGERPQKGRFREFYQFDIDMVAVDELPLSCDAEILAAFERAFNSLGLAQHEVRINSRKILFGIYQSLNLTPELQSKSITIIDKLDKIGPAGVVKELTGLGIAQATAEKMLEFCERKFKAHEVSKELEKLKISNENFDHGRIEIERVLELIPSASRENCVLDLSLARGLDYYTGLIFEVVFPKHRDFGSVGSGGRYDDLASQFINKKLPGVGASIGITRLVDLAIKNGMIGEDVGSKASAMVAVYSEEQRVFCNQTADEIRTHGFSCEVFFKSPKLGKQIDYAAEKGIRYVVFLATDGEGIEVKDLSSKVQSKFQNVDSWIRSL